MSVSSSSFAVRACFALRHGIVVLVLACLASPAAWAQNRNLAPGFDQLPTGVRTVLMPVDVELFSLSAGGVAEPRADWTADALRHMNQALRKRLGALQLDLVAADEKTADDFAEQVSLHAAVAQSINLHHGIGGNWSLPSKNGQLDWSFGDAMQPLAQRTGARYGIFVWVRDSYASAERKAAMVAMALFGVGMTGGIQTGYASLVDLQTGQVLWFNRLARATGDLRDEESALESMSQLTTGFPERKK